MVIGGEAVSEAERDEKVFACSMTTNYSESYLESLSDEDLLEVYERVMKSGNV